MVQAVKMPFLGSVRYDLLLHAFGVDAMEPASGETHAPCFLMCGRSVHANAWPDVAVPPPEAGNRVELASLVVVCAPDLLREDSCKASLVVTFDESRLPVPRFVLDWVASTVLSRVFTRQAARARLVGKCMATGTPNEHVQAMEADAEFYARWLPRRLSEVRALAARHSGGAEHQLAVPLTRARRVPPQRNLFDAMLACFGGNQEELSASDTILAAPTR